jgi:hypothetical protein
LIRSHENPDTEMNSDRTFSEPKVTLQGLGGTFLDALNRLCDAVSTNIKLGAENVHSF